ncbi:MAG: VaFE repeat-containing surface-anchored protein [Lachnospiraceae bacterium]|nr:VaFE repeat-containing surface-anchored protein [Lachnospiraceae bacterium]
MKRFWKKTAAVCLLFLLLFGQLKGAYPLAETMENEFSETQMSVPQEETETAAESTEECAAGTAEEEDAVICEVPSEDEAGTAESSEETEAGAGGEEAEERGREEAAEESAAAGEETSEEAAEVLREETKEETETAAEESEEETETGLEETEEETEDEPTEALCEEVTEETTEALREEMAEETETVPEETEDETTEEDLPLIRRVQGKSADEIYEILKDVPASEVDRLFLLLEADQGEVIFSMKDFLAYREAMYRTYRGSGKTAAAASRSSGGTAQIANYTELNEGKLAVGAFDIRYDGSTYSGSCLHHALQAQRSGSLQVLEAAELTSEDAGSWEYDYARLFYFMYENKTTAAEIYRSMYRSDSVWNGSNGLVKRHFPAPGSGKNLDRYYYILAALAGSYLNGIRKTGGSATAALRYSDSASYSDYYDMGEAVWRTIEGNSDYSDLPADVTMKLIFTYPEEKMHQPVVAWQSQTREEPAMYAAYVKKTVDASSEYQKQFHIAGAEYTIYTDENATKKLALTDSVTENVFVIRESGWSQRINLPEGVYYIRETFAPEGYDLDTEIHILYADEDHKTDWWVEVESKEPVTETPPAYVQKLVQVDPAYLEKYPIDGAEYTIYTDPEATRILPVSGGNEANVFVIRESGWSQPIRLELGTYYVKETKAPEGYRIDPEIHPLYVDEEHKVHYWVQVVSSEMPYRIRIALEKRSADETITQNHPGYSPEGAGFVLGKDDGTFYDGSGWGPKEEAKTFRTDAKGHLVIGALAPGRYQLWETEAPAGYLCASEPVTVDASLPSEDGETFTAVFSDTPIYDPAGLCIRKLSAYGAEEADLSGAEFAVRYYAGIYEEEKLPEDADAAWVIRTAKRGGLYEAVLDEEHLVSGDGAVYGKNEEGRFRIPLGTVQIEEVKAPEGFRLEEATLAPADGSGAYEGGKLLVHLQAVDDHCEAVFAYGRCEDLQDGFLLIARDRPVPQIRTQAAGKQTGASVEAAGEDTQIIDTVSYIDLQPGAEYVIQGLMKNPRTGETITDASGHDVTAEKRFVPENPDGSVELCFVLDARSLEGQSAVVWETLYRDGEEEASHRDLNDEAQTVHFPKIGTTAVCDQTEDHLAPAGEEAAITDRVRYENLVPGLTYTMSGRAADRESGEILAEAEETFIPEEPDGTVEMRFVFPAVNLAGRSVVILETCRYGDVCIAAHEDPEDEEQTVHFPRIETELTDAESGSHLVKAEGTVRLKDVVAYHNLIPGKEYVLRGVLVDRETGEALTADGEEVTAETAFVPEEPDGEAELEFSFPGEAAAGRSIVAFESCRYEERELAVHADVTDEAQSVYLPQIGTCAAEESSGERLAAADPKTVLVDTVSYRGLMPETEYLLEGVLMDCESQTPLLIRGEPVTAQTVLQTGAAKKGSFGCDGEACVRFVFDASGLEGKSIVVFETMYAGSEEIASHRDAGDEMQTVLFPKLLTSAHAKESDEKLLAADAEVLVTDEVHYENLVPGQEYVVQGKIVDRGSGEEIGSAETRFVPETDSGSVEVNFRVNTSAYAGKRLVVYEWLTDVKGRRIASHEDPENSDQTVTVRVPPNVPKTGDMFSLRVWLAAAAVSAVAAAWLVFRRRELF